MKMWSLEKFCGITFPLLVLFGCLELSLPLFFSGNYKVQAYDMNVKDYMPVTPGIGVHVEVVDPEKKVIISRVSI